MNLDLLLDTPWWLPAGLALVGLTVWISGNKRRDSALMNIGYAAVGLAVLVLVASYFLDTPKERAEKATGLFVRSVVSQDLDDIRNMLHPKASAKVLGAQTLYTDRDEILAAIDRADDQFGLQSADILGMESLQTDDVITITFNVVSNQTIIQRPLPTRWEFQFQRTADGWHLYAITALQIAGLRPEQMQRQFPLVR